MLLGHGAKILLVLGDTLNETNYYVFSIYF